MRLPSDITVTLRCNNDCAFCPRHTLRHVRVRGDLDRRLRDLRKRSDRVVLTGGEVTVLPDATRIVAAARSLGFQEIGLITNGRALADPGFARRLVDAGLTEACVTVYDLRSEVHDRLTRTPGSLAETLSGLDNLLADGDGSLPVRMNTVLCRDNADGMAPLLEWAAARGVRGFLVADAVLGETFGTPLSHDRVARVVRDSIPGVIWRGFPPCALPPWVTWEAQDIDTAAAPPGDLDAYFDEFRGQFLRCDAWERCGARARCPGLQRRYVERFGGDEVRPLPLEGDTPEFLEGFERQPDPGRIAVVPTTACQMRCTYCRVALGRENAPPEVLDRAVDLLLTSRRETLELQFFGGEPLLRRDEVVRTMRRGDEFAGRMGKRLRYTITTNGLLLDASLLEVLRDHDARVMFSIDGDPATMARYRPLAGRDRDAARSVIERNLVALVRSGVPHFVNVVVTPEAAVELPDRLEYLARVGVRTVQICYSTGPGWTAGRRIQFCEALATCARTVGGRMRIQNFGSHAEPTVLSNDLLVDVDGTLYGDTALFAEQVFPGLRDAYRLGSVFDLERFDGLRSSRARNLAILRETYESGTEERRLVEDHLQFGRQVQATLDRLAPMDVGSPVSGAASRKDRNPLLRAVLRQDLRGQAERMRRQPALLKLPLLLLENPCTHDCVMCRAKPLPPTPLERVRRWLRDNDGLGLKRLGLVGNEPLAHPEIDAIVEAARARGFERFDTLTTGAPLADPQRARWLADHGVRGYAVPLYSREPAIHDAITRCPGSHHDTLQAIDNLLDLGAGVHVHANLLQQNIDGVNDLERFVVDELGVPFCVVPVRPKDANLPYEALAPTYSEMIDRLDVTSIVAFPLCVAARISSSALPPADIVSDVLKVYLLDQPFVKPPKCAECRLFGRCAGTFRAYLDLHGDGELTPASR